MVGERAMSRGVWLLICSVGLSACGGAQRPVMASHQQVFEEEDTLAIALDRSPSGGESFTFCAAPAKDSPANLTNAAWLAFLAANEYSHMRFVAEVFAALGFRSPKGAGFKWGRCAIDLRVVRGFEKKHSSEVKAAHERGPRALRDYLAPFTHADHPETWGLCAAEWFDEGDYDGSEYPAAAFEKHLIQTPHVGHYLQFFSGGEFVLEGKAFSEGSSQVVFARHRQLPVVIISFRGTEPDKWRDVAVDGTAWKVKLRKHGWPEAWGSVHQGFLGAYQSVSEVLETKLQELEGTGTGIWITGHSLGGALATVMSAKLMRQIEGGADLKLRGVYTFGSPRVGNTIFRDHYNEVTKRLGVRVVRFRNGNDLVTHIPGMIDYKHVGVLAHLTEAGLDFDPKEEPEYGGLGKAGDHNMVGWDGSMNPKSGYYRRLLDVLRKTPALSPLNRCSSGAKTDTPTPTTAPDATTPSGSVVDVPSP